MKFLQLFFSKHWDALIASIAVALVIYFLTRYNGIGLSPDSISYSTAAINLKNRFALLDFNRMPLVDFPAGFPFFLSLFYAITSITPIVFAPVLNGLLYIGVIIMSGIIMDGFAEVTRGYRILILSILASSTCLWEVYSMLWSETVFLFLILLFILQWKSFVKSTTSINLIILALITTIAFVTRFAGISLLVTGLALILFDGNIPKLKKLKQLLLFFFISISMVAWNLYRNHQLSGTAAGVREKALRSIAENLLDIGTVLGTWLPFINNHRVMGASVFFLLVLVSILVFIYRILQQQFYHRISTAVYVYFFVYAVFIVGISSVSRFEDLSSRLLSPLYIPMLFVASSWLLTFLKNKTQLIKIGTTLFVFFLFVFCIRNQYKQNAENWEGIAGAGIPGYSENQWTKSPTIQYINAHKDSINGSIYSDAPGGLYQLTGIQSLPLPHKDIAKEQEELFSHKKLIVIWFNDGINQDLIDIPFILKVKAMTGIQKFADGSIYYFSDKDSIATKIQQ
jgi:hypothetical protein